MKSLEGHFLIASPRMSDQRFDRTVILMLHHDASGAMGIVLNRPIREQLTGPWELLDVLASKDNSQVQMGGPVAGPLIVLRDLAEDESGVKQGGVFLVEKREQLEKLVQQNDASLRYFVGHAGWGKGQLETEIQQGSWLIAKASPEIVFADHEEMWVQAIREAGRSIYRDVLGITGFPSDSSLN